MDKLGDNCGGIETMELEKFSFGMGVRYLNALKEYKTVIAKHVCENLFDRHIKRLFMAD
jgi:hypothetical protein